jgi:cell division protein ZapA (FtsZ GTPase activity inhibitor)
MNDRREVVRIQIAGEEFTLRTDTSADETRAVAAYVDQAIRTVLDGGPMETRKAAILVSLQLADELLRLRAAEQATAAHLRALAQQLRPMLPPTQRGDATERRAD